MEDSKAPSRYAKACIECATTKAKCIRRNTANKCERCARLNKVCVARTTTSRAPRPPKPNRLTQMEQKLDGIVTLLAASQPQSQAQLPAAPDSRPFLTPNSLSPNTRTCEFGSIQIPLAPVVPLEQKAQKCSCSETPIPDGPSKDTFMGAWMPGRKCHDSSGSCSLLVLDLDDEVSATLLDNYQVSMARYFPFVVIPLSTTAPQLRISKPFLFLSIMAVSSYQKNGQQTTLSTEIMRLLSERMLLKGEKSLDLLQGVLVYAEWYHSHRLVDQQLTNILQLSVALLIDLGLNRSPCTSDKHQISNDTSKLLHGNSMYSPSRTNDERRAFLGCFYLTSILSSCFKKLEALRCTNQVEQSCDTISRNPEYESDIYLVQLVKLQQIAEQITHTLPCDTPQSFWISKPPIEMLVKAFQAELQSFRDSLHQSLQEDTSVLLHFQSTTIHLLEISLHFHLYDPSRPSSRLTNLYSALLATTAYLTNFLSLQTASYSCRPFTFWAQTLHALQVHAKLSLLPPSEVPGWDISHVREVLDYSTILERLEQRFEEAREEEERALREMRDLGAGQGPVMSRYELYAQRVRRVKAWYEGKAALLGIATQSVVGQEREDDGNRGGIGDGSGNVGIGVQGGLRDDFHMGMPGSTNMFGDDLDDAYWADFLGEWGTF